MTRFEFDHRQLEANQLTDHGLVKPVQFAQRESDIVENRQRGKQRALLEQHAETAAQGAAAEGIGIGDWLTKQAHRAALRRQQPDDFTQQRRFATAGAADQRHHLSGQNVQIEIAVNDRLAEARR